MSNLSIPQLLDVSQADDEEYARGWNAAVFLMGNTRGSYHYPTPGHIQSYMYGWNAAYRIAGIMPPNVYEPAKIKRRGI